MENKILDLRKGFGDFPEYRLSKFPDNSIKFKLKQKVYKGKLLVKATLRCSDDIFTLALVKSTLSDYVRKDTKITLQINYMMYQQDDRKFSDGESFGLKVIADFINNMGWDEVILFHPHSDKVEFINNCKIVDNSSFVNAAISCMDSDAYWVIPDSGAFKTQYKQIQEIAYKNFITCMKSRSHTTGEIETVVNCEDLKGKDCFIVDDICLGGRTFINIAEKLKEKGCGKLYLIVSHGVFPHGVDPILTHFEEIFTTDSLYTGDNPKINVYQL